jgi:hypothetical protein
MTPVRVCARAGDLEPESNNNDNFAGMEWNNQDIHGRMVLNLLHNVQSDQDKSFARR